MSFSGARGLVLLSRSSCEWLAAMIADRVNERDFYSAVTGSKYTGNYGLQRSAIQRGIQFERRLYADNAAELRRVLSPLCDVAPEKMSVLSFASDNDQAGDNLRVRRENLEVMRSVLSDLRDGKMVPHLIVQPQLQLPIDDREARYIAPDFLLLLGADGDKQYICGEIKSNIVQDNMAPPTDRQRARLQAAVEVLALQAEMERGDMDSTASNRAVMVYSSPYGLSPARPIIEQLDAEVYEIRRAVVRLRNILARLRDLRQGVIVPLQELMPKLTPLYTENCPHICLLADVCKQRVAGQGQALGDVAAALLGYETDLARLVSLLNNTVPPEQCTQDELNFVAQMSKLSRCIDVINDARDWRPYDSGD